MTRHSHLKTRILGGRLKGRVLSYPSDRRLRPTMQRTKSSVFETLATDLDDAVFVDLYAAAGGIGIEALSRGARCVHFVEHDPVALKCLRENLERCAIGPDRGVVHGGHVLEFLRRKALAGINPSIIYADPPYAADETLLLLEFFGKIDYPFNALLVLEHHKDAVSLESFGTLARTRQKRFGQSCVSYVVLTGGDST